MTSHLPAPPIPADADLRHFPCVSINAADLRNSDMAIEGDPADNWFCIILMMAAWHQLPAGSLPDDDAKLAYLAGMGRDLRGWKKRRKGALRGWVLCSDGRLYHPMMVEAVHEALQKSQRGRRSAETRWDLAASSFDQPIENIEKQKCDGIADAMLGTERNRTEKKVSSLRSDTPPVTPQAPRSEKGAGEAASVPPNPTPQTELPLKPKPAQRGSRLPPDWALPPEWREDALALGLRWNRIDRTADSFRDYWLAAAGSKGVKQDWRATWRNWVRREAEGGGNRGSYLTRTSDGRNQPQTTADLAAEIRAEWGGDPRFRTPGDEPPAFQGHTGPTIETNWEREP